MFMKALFEILFIKYISPLVQFHWHSLQKTFNRSLTLPPLDPIISTVDKWDTNNPNHVLVNHIGLLFKKFICQNRSNPRRIHILTLKHYIKSVRII